ncbi:SDR family NAD(P)-dependent oxidoreductase [Loktanella sp. SALINAS62]|uniref:SDR family NAD(P)-dependent oxidoreductase n=1 Tax=Loktanella sp. SALINAS62 TaxID=2706124 RepID=UPI001B8C474D|nr:SDR family NAD(P)-dependent oxidoreductase [Loktanella sp. SALINAS62]MBS1301916.1 SDR family NAD(P)-dependent oxidoreductase [Loktanella sp. SALINAS62]
MSDWQGKRYWLIGASEGLGRALAHQLSKVGAEVIVSARSEDRLKALVDELPGKASFQTVDVSDIASVKDAYAAVGKIDGMVYLAGAYWPMPATEWDQDKADTMAVVNYLGAQRCVGAVIGDMVARDGGHILLTSSLTAYRGLPGSIGYTASKAAILSLAECLYADLRKTGVKVQVANPGFIKTRLTDKNDFNMPQIMEPEDAAREMFELMDSDNFKKTFPRALGSLFRVGQFLPDALYYRIFGR